MNYLSIWNQKIKDMKRLRKEIDLVGSIKTKSLKGDIDIKKFENVRKL